VIVIVLIVIVSTKQKSERRKAKPKAKPCVCVCVCVPRLVYLVTASFPGRLFPSPVQLTLRHLVAGFVDSIIHNHLE